MTDLIRTLRGHIASWRHAASVRDENHPAAPPHMAGYQEGYAAALRSLAETVERLLPADAPSALAPPPEPGCGGRACEYHGVHIPALHPTPVAERGQGELR